MKGYKAEASVKDGLWLKHEHGKNVIKVWASSISGKEKVYLNDTLVSEQRNLKKEHSHFFLDENGESYSVIFKMDSYLKKSVQCVIEHEGIVLTTFKITFKSTNKLSFLRIGILIVLSIIYGIIQAIYQLPTLYFILFLFAIIMSSFFRKDLVQIIVEEE